MSDINSLIANYLQQTNSTADISDVSERVKNFYNEIDWLDTSNIFSFGDEATEEDFLNYMSSAMGKDSAEIADDVQLLFDILNSESDDDVLTSDELELFEHNDTVNNFGIWNQLSTVSEGKIQQEINNTESADTTSNTTDSNNDVSSTTSETATSEDIDIYEIAQSIIDGEANINDYYGVLTADQYTALYEALDELEAAKESEETEESDETNETDKTDETADDSNLLSLSEMREKIQEIITASDTDGYKSPEDFIKELEANLETSGYDQKFIDELRASYTVYSDEDEEKITAKLTAMQLYNSDATRADAISALEEEGGIGDPILTSETEIETAAETETEAEEEEDVSEDTETTESNYNYEVTDETALQYLAAIEDAMQIKDSVSDEVYEKKIDEAVLAVMNSTEISMEEKLNFLGSVSELDSEYVQNMLSEDDSFLTDSLLEMTNTDSEYTTEEILEFIDKYNDIQGSTTIEKTKDYKEYLDGVVRLYSKAASEGKLDLVENHDESLSPEYIANEIQDTFKWGTETQYLSRLMQSLSSGLSTDCEDYGLSDTQAEMLKDTYYKKGIFGGTKDTKSVKNVLEAYHNGNLSKEEAQYLLQDLSGGDASALIEDFRDMSSENEETYIEDLFEIYSTADSEEEE